jgi:hypothetical protein
MKINSILIGKGTGSAGNVTVVQLKGQTILKQKASIVANPKSPAQVLQRKMMNRSIYAWQLIGNVIKQGWTSLLPHCSQVNTYVSENAAFFKAATFTKENMSNQEFIGSVATKGSLGSLVVSWDDTVLLGSKFNLNKANLNAIAQIGDKLVVIGGNPDGFEMGTQEIEVDPVLLASANPIITADIGAEVGGGQPTFAVFLVSEDGRKSTTSVFN